jgi:hypothetical protein
MWPLKDRVKLEHCSNTTLRMLQVRNHTMDNEEVVRREKRLKIADNEKVNDFPHKMSLFVHISFALMNLHLNLLASTFQKAEQ